jgi:hypothetical protein
LRLCRHRKNAHKHPCLSGICNDFFTFSWSDEEDVSTHVAKLLTLWNELNGGLMVAEEHALPNQLFICKVMSILPKSFESFKSSWMLIEKGKNKPLDDLTSKLCMFEINFVTSPTQKTVKEVQNFTQFSSVANNTVLINDRRTFNLSQLPPCTKKHLGP